MAVVAQHPVGRRPEWASRLIPSSLNPGDPQSLNRYSYVLNNPLRFVDPSGHAECGPNDQACWQNEWYWKNRWYNAHGYFDNGNGWSATGFALFADVDILSDVLAEAGIAFSGQWNWNSSSVQMSAIGQGVVEFGRRLGGRSVL